MPKNRGAQQGDADGPLECSLALGMVAAETRRVAVDDPSEEQPLKNSHCKQATQPECKKQSTSSLAARKSSLVPTTRSMRSKKKEAWQISGTWTTVTSCATQPWCCLCAGLRRCQCQSRSGAEPTGNRSHLLCERPGRSTA